MADEMKPCERALAALRRQEIDRVPYLEHLVDQEVVQGITGEKRMFKEVEISRLLGRDNITYWGAVPPFFVKWEKTRTGERWMGDGLIKTRDDLGLMELPDPYRREFYRSAEEFVREKEDFAACAILFLGIDPTLHSMGLEGFAYALADDPGLIEEVLGRYADWSAKTAEVLIEVGFDFIWAADDIAFGTGTMFSPRVYHDSILPRLRKVAAKVTIPWIYHSDGNLLPIMEDYLSLGMNAIHPIEPYAMDIFQLKKDYGDRVCLVGNIDINTLTLGTPEEVEEEVKEKIRRLAPGGGYIVSSCNSVSSYCKPENVLAMVEAVRKYGRYPIQI
jgi:hypothetical protein